MVAVLEIKNGDIIRLSHDKLRDWVAIHHSRCYSESIEKYNKNVKDNTGYYLFSGLWYEGDASTNKPYGKCIGQLKRGMFADISVVGSIYNKDDYERYKRHERL